MNATAKGCKMLSQAVLMQVIADAGLEKTGVLKEIDEGKLDLWLAMIGLERDAFREIIEHTSATTEKLYTVAQISRIIGLNVSTARKTVLRFCDVKIRDGYKKTTLQSFERGLRKELSGQKIYTQAKKDALIVLEGLRTND